MAIAGMTVAPNSVGLTELNLNQGDLSGDLICGGIQQNFASQGIRDLAVNPQLTVQEDKIVCTPALTAPNIDTASISHNGHAYIEFDRGVVKINGQLKADIEQVELKVTDKLLRAAVNVNDLQHLQGAGIALGNSLITFTYDYTSDSFKVNTNLDIKDGSSLRINGEVVIDQNRLGSKVQFSKLKTVGVLKDLEVEGDLNVNDDLYYNASTGYMGLGTIEPAYRLHLTEKRTQYITGTHREYFSAGTLNGNNWHLICSGQHVLQVEPKGLYVNPTGTSSGGAVLRLRHIDDESLIHTLAVDTLPQKDAIIVKDSQGIQLRLRDGNLSAGTSIGVGSKKISWAVTVPESGRWEQGSVVYNSTPQSGQHVGWVCIESGEPGVWRTFGKID